LKTKSVWGNPPSRIYSFIKFLNGVYHAKKLNVLIVGCADGKFVLLNKKIDVVFTSCSLQYKNNRDSPVENLINILQEHVCNGGYLYMDYMLALEDRHTWKSQHFFRTGQIHKYFSAGWRTIYIREMKTPVFEAAHIDRISDHFHRFGYILTQKLEEQ